MSTFLKTLKGRIAIAGVLLLLVAAVAVSAVVLLKKDEYRSIVVKEVSGTVTVINDKSQKVDAYGGMALFDGDRIEVGDRSSLTIELDGDKFMLAESNTKFTLEATGTVGSEKTRIILDEGSTLYNLENKLNDEQRFEVSTPSSTISVRGTLFDVAVGINADGNTFSRTNVYNGTVLVFKINRKGENVGEPIRVGESQSVTLYFPEDEDGIPDSDESQFEHNPLGGLTFDIDLRIPPIGMLEMLKEFVSNGFHVSFTDIELQKAIDDRHSHKWSDEWSFDENIHWHEDICGHITTYKNDEGAHEYKDSEPRVDNDGKQTITRTCTICGYKVNVLLDPTPHEHVYDNNKWLVGENGHYRVCTECEEGKTEEQPHTCGTATCTAKAVCTVCNTEYGDLLPHSFTVLQSNGTQHWHKCASCDATDTKTAHTYGDSSVEGFDPDGLPATMYTCTVCQHKKYELKVKPSDGLSGQFAVNGVGYETWKETAVALSDDGGSRTAYIIRDLWDYDFDYIYGAVSLPYDNLYTGNAETLQTAAFGLDTVPEFYSMTWDLNSYGFRMGRYSPPRIYAGATWTIRATGGGMIDTEGYGLYNPYFGGILEGRIVIIEGMFDFDPTEYVSEGYTVKCILAPDFVMGTDMSSETVDYASILAKYGTYSAIMNDRDADEEERYALRTPGLWFVYPDRRDLSECTHECFRFDYTDDLDIVHYICSGCGAECTEHRHSLYWISNEEECGQSCAICYQDIIAFGKHTFDNGVASTNEFGETVTVYTCTSCGYKDARVVCTGTHVYGAGVEGTDESGAPTMIYTCIHCSAETTDSTVGVHECTPNYDNPMYNDYYHWYSCAGADGCIAKHEYCEHMYEAGCEISTAKKDGTYGIIASVCYCGRILPGSEQETEFYDYFLDFSECTTEGISTDNTIYIGDPFDYENIKLVGVYEDTEFEWDENYNVIGYDAGRVLEPNEYKVRYYRIYNYSFGERIELDSFDLTVPGEYEIRYELSDGYYYSVEVTVKARPTDGVNWLTIRADSTASENTVSKVVYSLNVDESVTDRKFNVRFDGELSGESTKTGVIHSELTNVDIGEINQLRVDLSAYDEIGTSATFNVSVLEGYSAFVHTGYFDEEENKYKYNLGYLGSEPLQIDSTVRYIVVLRSDLALSDEYMVSINDRLSGNNSGNIFGEDPNEGFLINVEIESASETAPE